MVNALLHELKLRSGYLKNKSVNTIYFGGGTPSVLPADDIRKLIRLSTELFEVSNDAEITLEANPDDLDKDKVKALRQTAVNRLSIGVQSFFDRDLQWMNRAHSGKEALDSIKRVQDTGIENITIDLIYGIPGLSDKEWKENIRRVLELGVPHISSYALTVEKGTALDSFISKGKVKPLDEEQSAAQFEQLMEELAGAGYEHYEISNFSKPGFHSRHNSAYWQGEHYMGIGPSAHSFDGDSRQWNIANNHAYIHSLALDEIPSTVEILTQENKINEYLMTSLRTSQGASLRYIEELFGSSVKEQLEKNAEPFIKSNWLEKKEHIIRTTSAGKLMADRIASELFMIKEEDN